MHTTFRLSVFLLFMVQLFCSCTSDSLPEPDSTQPETLAGIPDAYQDKIRTQPYPKADNELYLNPAPLIVPQAMKTGERLQFSLSRTEDFSSSETLLSEPQEWCMYNLHRRLEVGTWYWRFRSTNLNGTTPGEWSAIYRFEVKNDTPEFVTPPFRTFLANAPRLHPRIYCFLDDRIGEARNRVTSHPEYAELQSRASQALKAEYTGMTDLYSRAEELRQHATYLYQAYHLTQKEIYAEKLRQLLEALIAAPPADGQLFASNFTASNIAWCLVAAYDLLYNNLSASDRTAAEELMMRVARYYYKVNCGFQENHLFDNHFWQQNMRVLFQVALSLYDKPTYSSEVLPMMEYYYELWTARAPASGFNRDGIWHNGTGYFSANILTLAYMPSLLSFISRYDFLSHPWYQNAGRSLVYTCPPGSKSNGFGDSSEKGSEPNRLIAAFADYLACETGNSYAGWYAGECRDLLRRDYELRLYRMCTDQDYNTTFPAGADKMVWYKDAGEVAMHSAPEDTGKDLALSFRSSTFGSGSHTTASQNAFNLLYKGVDVYRSTGYYQNFSDAHNLMSYRHTRAHNSLLVNGIGQPYSTEGYGSVMRAMGGQHISYCLGDASHAYRGISNDPMWVGYFKQAGIEQTPENGFGATPLTKYRRHVLMLHPHTVIVYDELEASEAVRWEWLLHSPTEFKMDATKKTLSTNNKTKGWMAVTQLFGGHVFTLSQTDRFVVPPAITGAEYPNQWHLTARVDGSSATRFLAIIQVGDEAVPAIYRDGDTFSVGDWTIKAVLDASKAPELTVNHRTEQVVFSYGTDNPVLNGAFHPRQYTGSSLLYDEINGVYQVVEMTDRSPISTRVANQ
ncbi:DUF4962 domain-containing protein [Bacteroides sp.]|uniref:DUF4962 domain-containing protein n=1 Tax=Bacteroides sp. TaxID=29523 RepID=UPI00402774BD